MTHTTNVCGTRGGQQEERIPTKRCWEQSVAHLGVSVSSLRKNVVIFSVFQFNVEVSKWTPHSAMRKDPQF